MSDAFLWAQIIGVIAMCCNVLALQLKSPRHIILSEAPASILWSAQYALLGGYMGAFIHLLVATRAIGLTYSKKAWILPILCIYLTIAWGIGLYNFQQWYDALPLFSTTIGCFILFHRDNRPLIARGLIFTNCLWIIYNILVLSWMGALCSAFVITSCVIGMYRHEKWQLGKCFKTFPPSVIRALCALPSLRSA